MPAIKATILSGAAVSEAINVGSDRVHGVIIPAMTTSTVLNFQVSQKIDGTFVDLYDAGGTAASATCSTSAARAVGLDPILFQGWSYMKVRAGTGAGNNQTGDKSIYLVVRNPNN